MRKSVWRGFRTEVAEVIWLASVISALSVLGVGAGVLLALGLGSTAFAMPF